MVILAIKCFEVKLTTVSFGKEISWTLDSCESNGGYGNNGEYTQQCCLSPGSYNLECKDSFGDGWNGGYIEVGGIKYCDSFTSGNEETSEIIVQAGGKYFSIFLIFPLPETWKCFSSVGNPNGKWVNFWLKKFSF